MTAEDRADRIASLPRQLRFHHTRREVVEDDPELSPDERADQLEYHDRLAVRLLGQLIELEWH